MTEAPWTLVVSPSAELAPARLPRTATVAVVKFLLGPLVRDPTGVGHPLQRGLRGLWVARQGPYRVVYEIDEAARSVRILRIDHRADVHTRAEDRLEDLLGALGSDVYPEGYLQELRGEWD